ILAVALVIPAVNGVTARVVLSRPIEKASVVYQRSPSGPATILRNPWRGLGYSVTAPLGVILPTLLPYSVNQTSPSDPVAIPYVGLVMPAVKIVATPAGVSLPIRPVPRAVTESVNH